MIGNKSMFAEIQAPLPSPTEPPLWTSPTARPTASPSPKSRAALYSPVGPAWASGSGSGGEHSAAATGECERGEDEGDGGGGVDTAVDAATAAVTSLPAAPAPLATASWLSSRALCDSSCATRRLRAAISAFMARFSRWARSILVSIESTFMRLRMRERCALSRFLMARRLRLYERTSSAEAYGPGSSSAASLRASRSWSSTEISLPRIVRLGAVAARCMSFIVSGWGSAGSFARVKAQGGGVSL